MRPLSTLAILLSLTAAPVLAQTSPAGRPPRPDAAQRQVRHAEMRMREADDLALLLDLKPAQRPLLDGFLKSAGPPERSMDGKPAMPPQGATSEPGFEQHIARMEEMSARHAAEEARQLAAVRSFYGTLDPHQKQLFEALMRLRHGMGGHGGPRRGPDGQGGPNGMPHGDGPPPAN